VAVDRALPVTAVARLSGSSVPTVHNFRRYRRERGTLEPRKAGSSRHRKLTRNGLDLIRWLIDEDPGSTTNGIRVQARCVQQA